MRFIEVKKGFFILAVICLCLLGSCKKACYTCTQYCAYCINLDSTQLLEACALKNDQETAIGDSLSKWGLGRHCNLLNNTTNICDNKNGSDAAVTYYQKENYFCDPQ